MPDTDETRDFELAELDRRIANIVRVGTVSETDYAAARARVVIGGIETAWLPWITARAGGDRSWWAPETGEQVVVMSPSGDLAQGVIQAALYSTARPAPASSSDIRRTVFGDGTVIEYDRAASAMLLDLTAPGGTVRIVTGTSEILIGPGSIAIRADRIDLNDDR